MIEFYRYGLPENISEEEKVALKQKIKKLQGDTDRILQDPEELKKIYQNAKMSCACTAEELNQQFTI